MVQTTPIVNCIWYMDKSHNRYKKSKSFNVKPNALLDLRRVLSSGAFHMKYGCHSCCTVYGALLQTGPFVFPSPSKGLCLPLGAVVYSSTVSGLHCGCTSGLPTYRCLRCFFLFFLGNSISLGPAPLWTFLQQPCSFSSLATPHVAVLIAFLFFFLTEYQHSSITLYKMLVLR